MGKKKTPENYFGLDKFINMAKGFDKLVLEGIAIRITNHIIRGENDSEWWETKGIKKVNDLRKDFGRKLKSVAVKLKKEGPPDKSSPGGGDLLSLLKGFQKKS